ncbi:short-chain dehydrogenase [Solimonas fluminis]|uniref:Short-chain dehydrogenase n=1 Tax=Solimonas fluminis TaxID=2086571 RepID=A0A2S5TAP9_9GAMM|nr:oxidoreductase [Solimonas fluminis]PPE72083.1 short-chain dehydrogenase [Solimonas fluminis]
MTQKWTTARMPSQAGRTAIVTGANSGLGLETAIALAAAGARVIMACRNPAKAAAALEKVRERVPNADAALMTLDLSSLASVRTFAEQFKAQHPRLDLLVNNAGILGVPLGHTADGFENHMGTNHLGHFALTGLLIDPILATPGARVITVGSLGHWRGKLDLDDLHFERTPYVPFAGYANSKQANLLFVTELARRLAAKGSGVIAAAGHPGGADTTIKPRTDTFKQRFEDAVIAPIARRWLINTAAAGALPTLYAATMPDVKPDDYWGPDGFAGLRGYPTQARRKASSKDPELARRLWEVSARLTGVSYLD